FRAAMSRIGFNVNVQNEVIRQGFNTIDDLNVLGKDDVKRICKIIRENEEVVTIPFMQQQLFEAMRYWVKTRTQRGQNTAANLFTRETAIEYMQLLLTDSEDTLEKAETKTMPGKFVVQSNWNVFKEAVDTYLSQLKGIDRIPLNYVIRIDEIPAADAIYHNDLNELINTVPLRGDHFNRDNDRVYGIIKSLVLEGPGWNWIMHLDRARNGRLAWHSLVSHYEGDVVMSRVKAEAYASLSSAQYHGERKNFSFETFTNIHQKAHQDLLRLGDPISEDRKVHEFLNHIDDPNLSAGKAAVLATLTLAHDFTNTANYLSNFVARAKSLHATERRISGLDSSSGRFGRGRRGHGRDRGRGRTNRANNRGHTDNDLTRKYSNYEWRHLPSDQKTKIMQAREEKKKRNASALTSVDEDAKKLKESNAGNDNAGDQFGRQAHSSK
ncbi:MAG: hypothetical protein ACRDL7_02410, partial [Gaiellaceae bacterium]